MYAFITRTWAGLFLLVAMAACHTNDDLPPARPSGASLELVKGDGQKGQFGALLADSLVMRILVRDTTLRNKLTVTYKMKTGNGYVEEYHSGFPGTGLRPDAKGIVRGRWSLGCNSTTQAVTFYLYPDSCTGYVPDARCKPLDSLTFEATAGKPTGWSRACGIGFVDPYGSAFTACAGKVYAVAGGKAYRSEDDGVNWTELSPPAGNDPVKLLKCNGQGHVYVVTENQGVFYSKNQGGSWTEINNGILDHRYPLDLVVEDNTLFVSFNFDGLYRSTNNGAFWRKLLVGGRYGEEYAHVTRMPSGDLYLFDKWSKLFKSTNNGDNWLLQDLGHNYARSPAGDMAADQAGNLVIASSYDGYLAVLSPATLTGSVTSFYTPETHSTCMVYQITPARDKLYFLVSGNLKPGVYSGTPGNYAHAHPDFTGQVSSFFVRPDGSLLLGSHSGVYYFAK
ncbi:MAG: GH74 [uncultured Cytophagales bacterium]|uniref:GH74 n=1 Tax=uncultured Cytophagales bacterium TaxID=158755 RepID=A0A6J4I5N3_9SPHI|nr:MAG: GH74 [uncultured Cytophagales bacterium]